MQASGRPVIGDTNNHYNATIAQAEDRNSTAAGTPATAAEK